MKQQPFTPYGEIPRAQQYTLRGLSGFFSSNEQTCGDWCRGRTDFADANTQCNAAVAAQTCTSATLNPFSWFDDPASRCENKCVTRFIQDGAAQPTVFGEMVDNMVAMMDQWERDAEVVKLDITGLNKLLATYRAAKASNSALATKAATLGYPASYQTRLAQVRGREAAIDAEIGKAKTTDGAPYSLGMTFTVPMIAAIVVVVVAGIAGVVYMTVTLFDQITDYLNLSKFTESCMESAEKIADPEAKRKQIELCKPPTSKGGPWGYVVAGAAGLVGVTVLGLWAYRKWGK